MKIFQLIDWLTKLFKLNNKSKVILLILLPLPIFSQNNAAFWLGKRASGAAQELPIITDNLIAYYDASNPDSYPGTGTTWFDLSGNNYDLTLTNASQYENVNGGVIDFENELASRTGVINTEVHTISMWFNSDNSFNDNNALYGNLIDINSDETLVHLGSSTASVSGEDITIINTNPTYGRTMATDAPNSANTWYYLTLTFDGSSNKYLIYVNGVERLTTSGVDTNASVIKNLTNLKVGTRGTYNLYFYGKIGELYFYSDRLTEEEILLNYNNTKARYN